MPCIPKYAQRIIDAHPEVVPEGFAFEYTYRSMVFNPEPCGVCGRAMSLSTGRANR